MQFADIGKIDNFLLLLLADAPVLRSRMYSSHVISPISEFSTRGSDQAFKWPLSWLSFSRRAYNHKQLTVCPIC